MADSTRHKQYVQHYYYIDTILKQVTVIPYKEFITIDTFIFHGIISWICNCFTKCLTSVKFPTPPQNIYNYVDISVSSLDILEFFICEINFLCKS